MGGCSDLSGSAILLSTEKSVLRVGCTDMALSKKAEIRNNEFQAGTAMEMLLGLWKGSKLLSENTLRKIGW